MVVNCILPRGGHRDEVSYLEAFLLDSLHVQCRVETTGRVLPYGRFLTRVFMHGGSMSLRRAIGRLPSQLCNTPN